MNARASAVSALCAVLYSSRAAASSAATVFAAAARAAPHCLRAACPAPAAAHACQRGMSCASRTPCAGAIACAQPECPLPPAAPLQQEWKPAARGASSPPQQAPPAPRTARRVFARSRAQRETSRSTRSASIALPSTQQPCTAAELTPPPE
jgi:hypothetical protein